MGIKKTLAVALSAVLISTCFAGCNNENSASGKTTISVFNIKTEADAAYKKIVKDYEKSHPNVKVNFESVGGSSDYGATLKAKMASDPVCVFNVTGISERETWQSKLADLSDQPWVSHCDKAYLEAVTTNDGKIYGMPTAVEGYGFMINKEIFEYAGVDVESMFTFEGMKAGFDKLKNKINSGEMKSKYPNLTAVMALPAKETWVLGDHAINPILNKDFKTVTEAFNAKTIPFAGADVYKRLIDFQVSYTSDADNPPALNSVDYTSSFDGGFLLERVACVQQGTWTLPTIKQFDGSSSDKMLDKIDMIPYSLPDGSSDGCYVAFPASNWVINKDVDESKVEASKDFLNWMYQSDEGKTLITEECGFVTPFDNYGDLLPSDILNTRVMNAIKKRLTLNGALANSCPDTWSTKVAGANVQKYISGTTSWTDTIKASKEKWAEMRSGS